MLTNFGLTVGKLYNNMSELRIKIGCTLCFLPIKRFEKYLHDSQTEI